MNYTVHQSKQQNQCVSLQIFAVQKDDAKLVEKLSFGQLKSLWLRRFIWLPQAFAQPKVLTFWTTTFSYMESCEFDLI